MRWIGVALVAVRGGELLSGTRCRGWFRSPPRCAKRHLDDTDGTAVADLTALRVESAYMVFLAFQYVLWRSGFWHNRPVPPHAWA